MKDYRKSIYRYEPVPFDLFVSPPKYVRPGMLVRKCQPIGCPQNGTMGMCYVEDLDGNFLGMVCLASLKLAPHARP